MNFKKRQSASQVPEINLVPMMDVLMTVLTFFIIISMTLSGQAVNFLLPKAKGNDAQEATQAKQKLVVALNAKQEIRLKNKTLTSAELLDEMQRFLKENPDGTVVLKADRTLTYRDVSDLLKAMRDAGGGSVVLGIDLQS